MQKQVYLVISSFEENIPKKSNTASNSCREGFRAKGLEF
jgi:hypothetical protein